MAVAHHVAQPRVVARAQHGGQLVGQPCDLAHGGDRLLALWAVQLLFHLSQGGADHVVVVDVRADGLGDVEPEPVDLIEIAGA